MKKKRIILFCVVIFVIALVGRIVWSSRNTAEIEAKKVLIGFNVTTSGQWYCEDGAGSGGIEISNSIPWWEEIYLSNNDPETTVSKVEEHLKGKGYSASSQYIESGQSQYDDSLYWEISGTRANYSVTAKIKAWSLASNSCSKGFDNMNPSLNPEDYKSSIVIYFEDNS